MINIEGSTLSELRREYEECMQLWGQYPYDCFGYYISAIHKRIVELGGW